MRRHPVKDHADAFPMEIIDHIHKVFRRAVARGRGIVARDLIAPRSVEGMLGDPHQLDVGIAEVLDVIGRPLGELPICVKPVYAPVAGRMLHPRTDMAFVDNHRILVRIESCAFFHPGAVRPFQMRQIRHDGRGSRPKLHLVAVRIRLIEPFAVRSDDEILVHGADADTRNKDLPYADLVPVPDHVRVRIPAVEVAHHGNASGIRRPDRKICACLTVYFRRMRAQLLIEIVVRRMPEIILVRLSKLIFVFHRYPPHLFFTDNPASDRRKPDNLTLL